MKRVVLFFALFLSFSVVALAQGPCTDCGRSVAQARKPAGSGIATRIAGKVLGKAIINNTIGEEQPLPRQSRPRQPIQTIIDPPKTTSPPNKSTSSSRSRPDYAGRD